MRNDISPGWFGSYFNGTGAVWLTTLLTRISDESSAAGVLWRAGMFPRDARALVGGARSMARLGQFGGLPGYTAALHSDHVAIIDDRGALTFAEFADRAHRLANAFRAHFASPAPTVGVLCRNHADAVVTLCAAGAAGVRVVLLNSDFGPRQVAEVSARERLDGLIYDEDFAAAVEGFDGKKWCAWHGQDEPENALTRLIDGASNELPPRPASPASVVILTSGSTGVPKGAARGEARTLLLLAGLLSRIPLRGHERVLLSAPVFHGWGLIIAVLTLSLGSTLVLHRRFDAERVLADLERHRCAVLIAVPTMLRRLLALGDRVPAADLAALRVIASGGARLDGALVDEVHAAFGPVLYNLYGSSEASYISIATPEDMVVAPGSAGRPPRGTTVLITDDNGRAVPTGTDGRILVRTPGQIRTYTDGRAAGVGTAADGFLDTGDRGHLDASGRLHVRGRSDGMIVSGGENVFPEEVELALQRHPHIADATVAAVPDEEFGQRLRAYVVTTDSGALSVEAIRTYLAGELPRSRMPRDIVLVTELPRGSAGKVLRRTLDDLRETHS
jgi:fatty-acyl-CoA synthase